MDTITRRIDAITHIPDEYRRSSLPAPKSAKIEISGRCPLRCGFCALRTRENQPKTDMDFGLPAEFEGLHVPDVLPSGHHQAIAAWRRREQLRRTLQRRPDLLAHAMLSEDDLEVLTELRGEIEGDRPWRGKLA